MSSRISSRQWEQLSTYLDGKCTPRQKAAIERDLAVQPGLQQALSELTRLKSILCSVPLHRTPRNFTLQASQVRARRSFKLAPVLRYASLVAVLAAVVVLAIDLLPGMLTPSRAAAPQLAAAPMLESAQAVTQNPPIIYWNGAASNTTGVVGGYGGGGGGGDGRTEQVIGLGGGAPAAEAAVTPTPMAPAESLMVAPSAAEGVAQPTTSADQQRVAEPTPTAQAEEAVGKAAGEAPASPILGVRPTEEQGTIITTTAAASAPAVRLPLLRIVGLGLGLLAVTLLLVATFLRKRA
jgi:hypothetical protein